MRGRIFVNIAAAICLIVLGWMSCILFKDRSIFSLDLTISVADVLSIIVEVILAVFITRVLENSIQESRVEKDFFISDLSRIEEIYTELDKTCSSENSVLSLSVIVSEISRSKRILNKCWKLLEIYDTRFCRSNKAVYDAVVQSIKEVDSRLTEPKFYSQQSGFDPVKISKGRVYLNRTIRTDIEDSISKVKSNVFKMKVAINKK